MTRSERSNRGAFLMQPLAKAMALALGVVAVHADAPAAVTSSSTLQTKLHNLSQLSQTALQWRKQNPHPFWRNAQRHRLVHPHSTNKSVAAAVTVTNCVDDASSATTSGTLRNAVINAGDTDTINLACSNITLTQGALPISVNNLTIAGPAVGGATINGGDNDRVLYSTGSGTLALNNLTITHGVYTGMTVAAGGCIYDLNGEVSLTNSTVSNCHAISAGVPDSSTKYAAIGGGVAAYVVTMNNSTVTGNKASATGGGSAFGGGIFSYGYYYSNEVPGQRQQRRTLKSGTGGAGAVGTLVNSTISNNTAEGAQALGGGIGGKYTFYAFKTVVSGNTAQAIVASALAPPNLAKGSAATKYFALGGGGFDFYGTQMVASTITGNTVTTQAGADGYTLAGAFGQVYGSGGYTGFAYSTIDHNHSDFGVGGVFAKYGLGLYQATIANNTAYVAGGIAIGSGREGEGSSSFFYNSTIAANTATNIGGVYLDSGANLTLQSTIVATNVGQYGADLSYATETSTDGTKATRALTVAGSHNLIIDPGNVTVPPDTIHSNPLLGALANNGGPTRTMALSSSSPALNKGSNDLTFTYDQRGAGFPRVFGPAADIGAYEAQASATAAAVPALSTWTMAVLAGLLGLFGWRRRRSSS